MPDTLADALRRRDPDRWFTALFAPAPARETLFALYAFNHELARAPEAAREPGLTLIRLQWWREVVEGQARAHEVATPLQAALTEGRLEPSDLLSVIDAREREVEEDFSTLEAWRDWLLQGPGSLAVAAGRALGAPDAAQARLRALGAGYGMAGQRRNVAALARRGRCLLPRDLLASHGLGAADAIANPFSQSMAQVAATIADEARNLLGQAARCDGTWIAAALPAVLARRDLRQPWGPPAARSVSDKLAVVAAALTWRA